MHEPLFGFDRRRFLRAGAAGVVAATVPFAGRARAGEGQEPGTGKAKSVMIVLLSGGPSQLDMWDPKPEGQPKFGANSRPFQLPFLELPFANICQGSRSKPTAGASCARWRIVNTTIFLRPMSP